MTGDPCARSGRPGNSSRRSSWLRRNQTCPDALKRRWAYERRRRSFATAATSSFVKKRTRFPTPGSRPAQRAQRNGANLGSAIMGSASGAVKSYYILHCHLSGCRIAGPVRKKVFVQNPLVVAPRLLPRLGVLLEVLASKLLEGRGSSVSALRSWIAAPLHPPA